MINVATIHKIFINHSVRFYLLLIVNIRFTFA